MKLFSSSSTDEISTFRHADDRATPRSPGFPRSPCAPERFGCRAIHADLDRRPRHERLTKRFADELALWDANDHAHLLIIGTFGIGPTGIATLEEVALVITNDQWIPYEHVYDKALLDALIHAHRRFLKGLRYNLPSTKPLASVILSDTKPSATALYVITPGCPEGYAAEVHALAAESDLPLWIWDAAAGSPMPPLPTPATARAASGEAHPAQTQRARASD